MKRLINKIFWGVWLIYLAVIVILTFLGVLGGFPGYRIAITLLLIKIIYDKILSRQFFYIIMPIAIFFCLFGNDWHMEKLNPFGFIIAGILISAALNVLFGAGRGDKKIGYGTQMHKQQMQDAATGFVRIAAQGTGIIKYVNAQNMKRADVMCNFGTLKAYFDNTGLADGHAVIHVDSKFSSMEFYIPKSWNVIDNLRHSTPGDLEIEGTPNPDGTKAVTLEGNTSFGGLKIIYI